jgi:hypothetical protein
VAAQNRAAVDLSTVRGNGQQPCPDGHRVRPRLADETRRVNQLMPRSNAELTPIHSSLPSEPILCDMVDLFVEEMPGRLARMRKYFDSQDWDALRRAARQLGGVAASYGFDNLAPFAADLERTLLRRSTIDEIGGSLELLAAQCGRVVSTVPC